jgi:hypothetical protein
MHDLRIALRNKIIAKLNADNLKNFTNAEVHRVLGGTVCAKLNKLELKTMRKDGLTLEQVKNFIKY